MATSLTIQVRNAKQRLADARNEVSKLESEVAKLMAREQLDLVVAKEAELAPYTGGLNLGILRDSLVGEHTASDLEGKVGQAVCLLGHGAWETHEFREFLSDRGFVIAKPEEAFDALLLGRAINDHDFESIKAILDYHISAEQPLAVLSQELMVFALIQRQNPLEVLSEDELLELAEGHAGLEAVINYEGFEWPYFEPDPNTSSSAIYEFDPSALGAESPLHRIGYTVAEGRLTKAQRWVLLAEMFRTTREDVFLSEFERRAWGRPQTQQRLYAMAKHISWLIGFRGGAAPNAAERWREDLAWLKNNYFQRDMKFNWPSAARISAKTASHRANDSTVNRALSTTWPFATGSRP